MTVAQWLLLSMTVSIDGFFVGAATSLSGVKLRFVDILCVGLCVFLLSSAAAYFSLAIGSLATVAGVLLLCIIGISYIVSQKEAARFTARNSIVLGLAVATDASAAAIVIGSFGIPAPLIGMTMAAFHMFSVALGNQLPSKFAKPRIFRVCAGITLILLGLAKLF